jgi:hypothetical protein
MITRHSRGCTAAFFPANNRNPDTIRPRSLHMYHPPSPHASIEHDFSHPPISSSYLRYRPDPDLKPLPRLPSAKTNTIQPPLPLRDSPKSPHDPIMSPPRPSRLVSAPQRPMEAVDKRRWLGCSGGREGVEFRRDVEGGGRARAEALTVCVHTGFCRVLVVVGCVWGRSVGVGGIRVARSRRECAAGSDGGGGASGGGRVRLRR